ncbi:MAG TPA: ferritin-like domain-containing protein [Tepidisphaeraceae bacterium]|nr:ferritin-like domain-containing protein [Tepidisphaeraceae bacterium]
MKNNRNQEKEQISDSFLTHSAPNAKDQPTSGSLSRRSFLQKGLAAGAGTAAVGLVTDQAKAAGTNTHGVASTTTQGVSASGLTRGDAAILRFLAAIEILETDLWQQYNELGGIQDSEVPGGSGNSTYTAALKVLDADMPQHIHDNTEDEFTHFSFINAFLGSKGAQPANLDQFRTLPSSSATGAQQIGRLTNLMQLTVDTTWWTRYRSRDKNPDFGDTFPPAVPALSQGKFPAIPMTDADLTPAEHIQAIANTAGFHFAMIEQGGTSLYPSLAQRVTNVEVLRILLSIGPTETMHFQTWQDKAGNAPPLTDPTNGLVFPDLNSPPFGGEDFSTNLIMPEPTIFLDRKFPVCSIIRPTETQGAAMGAVKFLTDTGLFVGQSTAFFSLLNQLAQAADAARKGGG